MKNIDHKKLQQCEAFLCDPDGPRKVPFRFFKADEFAQLIGYFV
ncbi:hypothetical protein [Solitalea lacus]|nr:hypothetical protein [Solitalea lacus]